MTNLLRRAGALAAVSAALIGGAVLGTSPASAATSTDASSEARVIQLTNEQRAKVGCAAVRTEAKLTTAARVHSVDMVQKNYFSHTGSDGSTFVTRVQLS